MESEKLEKKKVKSHFYLKSGRRLIYLTGSGRPSYLLYSTMDFYCRIIIFYLRDAALSFMFLHILLALNTATDDQVLHIYFSL